MSHRNAIRKAAWLAAACASAALAATAAPAGEDVVTKTVETFETPAWRMSAWNKAAGSVLRVPDDAPDGGGADGSTALVAHFSGAGFEYWTAEPPAPIIVPGRLKAVSVWVKAGNDATTGYEPVVNFHDARGRGEVDGAKLEWPLRGVAREWKRFTFSVPAHWVAPVSIVGVTSHNWGRDNQKADATWLFSDLAVETDMHGVDPETGFPPGFAPDGAAEGPAPLPLFSLELSSGEACNVFAGAAPTLRLTARSWLADPAEVEVSMRVRRMADPGAAPVDLPKRTLKVVDIAAEDFVHTPDRYGVYEVTAEARRADGWTKTFATRFAHLPPPRPLTDAQRDASPYGLNVHGGRAVFVTPFTKAGIVWFRDYAFTYDWMARAKGENHRYDGWPYPRKNADLYFAQDARILACFQGAMGKLTPEEIRAGAKPSRAWAGEIVDAVRAFPEITAWEIDNEYELHGGRAQAERESGWKTYGNYHRAFGELVAATSLGEALAVENGRAGIAPELVREQVLSGAFDRIDVVNSHYYCGVEAPEENYANWNFHQDADELRQAACLFYDKLREGTAAARADGKPRRHWVTEFGWDTKAGNIVSLATQAAYLPRAYLMLMAAGVDKGFWFFDLDGDQANNFFDGCGLLAESPEHLPKPVLAAMAGMTHVLPSPEYVGTAFAGRGTWGYVLRQDGEYVVALWTVADVQDGPEIDLPARARFDLNANPLPAGAIRLGQAPTYWVGVPADSPFVQQARFAVETRMLVLACAGDSFDVVVTAKDLPGADAPGDFALALDLPPGWTWKADAPAIRGEDGVLRKAATVTVDPNATLADLAFTLSVKEDGGDAAAFPFRVLVQPALSLQVNALGRDPGPETIAATVTNRAKRAVRGHLLLTLPRGWTAERTEIPFDTLESGATREVEIPIVWTAEGGEGAMGAALAIQADDGSLVRRPLIPGRIAVARADDLPLDGDPAAWPAAAKVPGWIFGSTQSEPQLDAWLAWSPAGLYVGLDVKDSIVRANSPQTFWTGDALELFLDLAADRGDDRYVKGRHQFWLVPQPNLDGKVYVGRWKRGDEIPENRLDMPGIAGRAVRKDNGYAFTVLLPAAVLDGWAPEAGGAIGVNLNVSVRGRQFDREVFWPLSKARNAPGLPSQWGRAVLR